MSRARLNGRSQVTIPVEVRRQLHLQPGDEIDLEVHDGYAVLRKVPRSGLEALAMFGGPEWRGYADVVQRDRDEWDR